MWTAIFPGRWARERTAFLHSILSFVVFLFFDFLDTVLCFAYRFLDELFEGDSFRCYCENRREKETRENEVSETLFERRNVFREMGFRGFARKLGFPEKMGFLTFRRRRLLSERNRWSDCGCESCVSWTKSGDQKLHVVVKEPSSQEDFSKKPTENIIFIHGFMGSSSIWTETVFKHLPQHVTSNCRLFAVDLLGFGKSPKPRESLYTLRDHVEMIDKSIVLEHGLSSFHVVAHSMGCIIAVALAAKYSKIVKSVTLVAPPYFSALQEGTSLAVLNTLAKKKLWPPLAFGTAVMSWYEHIGRCICFIICRHHRIWERILKILSGKRELPFMVMDLTRHTHHSAWHSMHNVICGGAKFSDEYLQTLIDSGVKVCVIQGDQDVVVPFDCHNNMKTRFPVIDVNVVAGADHQTVVIGREEAFCERLETLWASSERIWTEDTI